MFKYPIAISLSPNTEKEDVWEAVKTLFKPWCWKKGKALRNVEQWFKDYFGVRDVYLFNSGRSALYAILKAFGIKEGDEVLIQAFTCVAVPGPIIWVGARPIFVDIDETLNINPGALEKHINRKTKAIVVQHTFGIPAKIHLIKKIAQKYNLILIEDCAHSLGAIYRGQKIGTFSDASFFSFGRDKVISSVFGGAAIINSKFKIQSAKLNEFREKLKYPSYSWISQQILHPIAFSLIILPLYNFLGIGKIILKLLQVLHLLSFPVYQEEKEGRKPKVFPARLPNALAILALIQLKKLDTFNKKRTKIAEVYQKELKKLPVKLAVFKTSFLRYPILTQKAKELLKLSKRKGIILGDWYSHIVDPKGVNLEKVGYQSGSCPLAEKIANEIVNLPTYPRTTTDEVYVVIRLIYNFFGKKYNTTKY